MKCCSRSTMSLSTTTLIAVSDPQTNILRHVVPPAIQRRIIYTTAINDLSQCRTLQVQAIEQWMSCSCLPHIQHLKSLGSIKANHRRHQHCKGTGRSCIVSRWNFKPDQVLAEHLLALPLATPLQSAFLSSGCNERMCQQSLQKVNAIHHMVASSRILLQRNILHHLLKIRLRYPTFRRSLEAFLHLESLLGRVTCTHRISPRLQHFLHRLQKYP